MKKIPLRTCCVTREKCEKRDLIRIVRMPSGEVKVDLTGKLNGRGAYICDNAECLEKAIKSKRLERNFETQINPEIYDELRKSMNA